VAEDVVDDQELVENAALLLAKQRMWLSRRDRRELLVRSRRSWAQSSTPLRYGGLALWRCCTRTPRPPDADARPMILE
jgi:hypothetical protein